jgi:hypothetical protein
MRRIPGGFGSFLDGESGRFRYDAAQLSDFGGRSKECLTARFLVSELPNRVIFTRLEASRETVQVLHHKLFAPVAQPDRAADF